MTFMGFPPYHSGFTWLHEKLKCFGNTPFIELSFLLDQACCSCRLQQWVCGKRGWRDFLYSPGGFDFLKYGLASRKEDALKSCWMGGWWMCIYHSPQFKKMHVHGIIISHIVSVWSHSFKQCLLTLCHLRNLASLEIHSSFGTVFGRLVVFVNLWVCFLEVQLALDLSFLYLRGSIHLANQ